MFLFLFLANADELLESLIVQLASIQKLLPEIPQVRLVSFLVFCSFNHG